MSIKDLGWPAILAMMSAFATVVIGVSSGFEQLLLSYPVQLIGLACLALSLWQTRRWLMLWFAPIFVAPLAMWLLLIAQCARGNCL
jgi:hypothetical protein